MGRFSGHEGRRLDVQQGEDEQWGAREISSGYYLGYMELDLHDTDIILC